MSIDLQMDETWQRIQREIAEFEEEVKGVGLYHRGYRFMPPYVCGRCGDPVSAAQFAFGRACGACDIGNSRARFSISDKRWFVGGPVVLENPDDRWLIHPQFIQATERENYRRIRIVPPPRVPKKGKQ